MASTKETTQSAPEVPVATMPGLSPEMAQLIAQTVAQSVAATIASMPQPAPAQSADTQVMEGLALAIAQLTDQGAGRQKVRIAPDELVKRRAAHDRCVEMVIAAQREGLKPLYRIVVPVFFDKQLVFPWVRAEENAKMIPNDIVWTGIPNEGMRPLNAEAKAIWEHYRRSVGNPFEIVGGVMPGRQWVTLRGRTITTDRRPVSQRYDPPTDSRLNDEPEKAWSDPTRKVVRVLGTMAAPVHQNTVGRH